MVTLFCQVISNTVFLSAQKTHKLFVCSLSNSVLLAKGPSAVFHRERKKRANLTQRWRKIRQDRRGRQGVRFTGKDCPAYMKSHHFNHRLDLYTLCFDKCSHCETFCRII